MESKSLLKIMAGSLAKLNSISEIANAEHDNLGENLRMVILTDYVRAADLPRKPNDVFKPTKLGVAPIFEILRRANANGPRLGILTGSLVIIPDNIQTALNEAINLIGLDKKHIKVSPMLGCVGYSKLSIKGIGNQQKVALITQLFNAGHIQILVGTQSLLGEGWDAPTINSLILASNVGSYMLSNQMRGRAIRIDQSRPDKVANIWHLATIEPQNDNFLPKIASGFFSNMMQNPYEDKLSKLGSDMDLLIKRFEVFECISNDETDQISNGIERLKISHSDWDVEHISVKNSNTLTSAAKRDKINTKWQSSLGDSTQRSHVQKVVETNYTPRKQSYSQTLQYLSISAILAATTSAAGALRQFQSINTVATVFMVFGGLTFIYSLPKLFKISRLFIKNGTLEKSLIQVGHVLLDGLFYADLFKNHPSHYTVEIKESIRGKHSITLQGASRAEEKMFFDALGEILGPVTNPRYILIRKSWLGSLLRKDYHAVPTVIGAKKKHAEYFAELWNKQIGLVELQYTRQKSGRKLLLHARSNSMASGFQRHVDRRSEWR